MEKELRRERKRNVPHRRRERFQGPLPVLVTIPMMKHVWNLRSQRAFHRLKHAIRGGRQRFGVSITNFAILGNHMHLIAETPDAESLSRAIKGLEVRVARRVNPMMNRKGQVIRDRYHASPLKSARGARRALRYVRENHRKHYTKDNWRVGTTTDRYSSWAGHVKLPKPTTKILLAAIAPDP